MYYKIITDNDWFVIDANDLYRCLQMSKNKINIIKYEHKHWKSQNKEKNKFDEYSVKSYNEWMKLNNV
jgi:hypothetical protein